MRYGARHRWELAADTGVGWSQEVCKVQEAHLGLPGLGHLAWAVANTWGGQKAEGGTPQGSAAGTLCSSSGGLLVFAGHRTDPLTTTVSSLAHQVHLPQHLPCGPDHCPSPLNEEQPQPLPRGPGCGSVPGLERWL